MPDPAVEIEGVSRRFGQREALFQVAFSIPRGEVFGLLGPNGGGKTTLFRILSTLLSPSGGRVRILGLDLPSQAAAVRRSIGVLFQSPSLDRKLRVEENLLHHGHLHGLRGRPLRERIAETLRQFGLSDRARDRVETLSGGLARRVELAKSLLAGPALLLLDEPSTGLDPGARLDLWNALRAVQAGGATVLLTTHLMEEAERCDRIGILDRGRLVALGTPRSLREEIGREVLAIRGREPERLRARIEERFGLQGSILDGAIRIEGAAAAALPPILEAFREDIESAGFAPPTLEDVFIRKTGRRFDGGEAA